MLNSLGRGSRAPFVHKTQSRDDRIEGLLVQLINQNRQLSEDVRQLRREVNQLKEENAELRRENAELQSGSNTCKKIAIGVGIGVAVVVVGTIVGIVAVRNPELIVPMVNGASRFLN